MARSRGSCLKSFFMVAALIVNQYKVVLTFVEKKVWRKQSCLEMKASDVKKFEVVRIELSKVISIVRLFASLFSTGD